MCSVHLVCGNRPLACCAAPLRRDRGRVLRRVVTELVEVGGRRRGRLVDAPNTPAVEPLQACILMSALT